MPGVRAAASRSNALRTSSWNGVAAFLSSDGHSVLQALHHERLRAGAIVIDRQHPDH